MTPLDLHANHPRETVEERLLKAAHSLFVGREVPLKQFIETIDAPELPCNVITIHGPGGMGKTTLLQEYRYICHEKSVECVYVDAQLIEARPDAFLGSIASELNVNPDNVLPELARRSDRLVLLVDTAEQLEPLSDWLALWFIPKISGTILVCFAGRTSFKHAFSSRPGWSDLVLDIQLRNFSDEESTHFLKRRGLSDSKVAELLLFTLGHPLGLALAESVASRLPEAPLDLSSDHSMIKTLLDRFVMNLPSPAHQTAVEVASIARFTTEELLADVFDSTNAHELFEWLRDQSFIQSGQRGLTPHDLARRVLLEDLRWRNPDWFAELHARLRSWYSKRMTGLDAVDQHITMSDYVYLYRHKKIVRPFYDALKAGGTWEAGIRFDSEVTEHDFLSIRSIIKQHEGEISAGYCDHWWKVQPDAFKVVKNAKNEVRGCMIAIQMDKKQSDSTTFCGDDPAALSVVACLKKAPLRTGEVALIIRYWMAEDSYQSISHVQMLSFIEASRLYLTLPNLAQSFFICRDMDRWKMIFMWANLPPIEGMHFSIESHEYGAFGHDWRRYPATTWLDSLAARDGGDQTQPPIEPSDTVVLSESAFETATMEALKHIARPGGLKANPLLRSTLVQEHPSYSNSTESGIEVLLHLLNDAAQSLKGTSSGDKEFRAIERTYFKPAASQEAAAEALDIPYSSFRRHLTHGKKRIFDALWQLEVGL